MLGGDFIRKPDRRMKLLIMIQGLWVITLIILTLWWGTLLREQSDEIATLQTQLGIPNAQVHLRLDRTERMITGESGSFVILILITNLVLLFFFVRDHQRGRSLQAFFASVTHELRTPLTSIKLQAGALQDGENNPKQIQFIQRLLEDVERLDAQVQRTLELARIEGGGTLTLQPIQIKSFFQSKVLSHYAENGDKIKIDCDLEPVFILADSTALTIIFRNILENSIKYSKSAAASVQVKGKLISQRYQLEINHSNSSFEGQTEHLGKLFYRGKNSQGAGVGLYLIKTLMSKMKGVATFSNADAAVFVTQLTFEVDHGA